MYTCDDCGRRAEWVRDDRNLCSRCCLLSFEIERVIQRLIQGKPAPRRG